MIRLLAISVIILLASCQPEDATPTGPVNDMFDASTATLLREGMWMGANNYSVAGSAKFYQQNDGTRVLVLDMFTSSNGPDLRVYLSTDASASSFVNLGKLKSTNGQQVYTIPAGTDLNQFRFALIWCQQFSVLFGKADTQ